jgi:glucan phosphoethanolaminetransferase (alkaline phosphatase superfamily)
MKTVKIIMILVVTGLTRVPSIFFPKNRSKRLKEWAAPGVYFRSFMSLTAFFSMITYNGDNSFCKNNSHSIRQIITPGSNFFVPRTLMRQ